MKINEIIKKYIKKIPKDDIYLLISSFLNCNKLDVLKYLDLDVDYSKIEKLFKKYIKGEPINYILNSKEFYGLNFFVDNRVLIPRFETELLVEKAIERIEKLEDKKINILDLCCGSGNIGLTLKSKFNDLNIDLSDISKEALEVANINKNNLALDVNLINSDLFNNLEKKYDIIISNPPYGERLSDDVGVTKLYAEMGQVFAPLKTWSKFILTSDESFESKYGSKADKKRKLYNGTLKVDLYQYFGERVKRQIKA